MHVRPFRIERYYARHEFSTRYMLSSSDCESRTIAELLERNRAIVQRNLPELQMFFERHADTFDWVRPTARPIGFPRVRGVGDVDRFCERLARAGVLLLPGSVYNEPDHARVGFGRANLPDALDVLESALAMPSDGLTAVPWPGGLHGPPRRDG